MKVDLNRLEDLKLNLSRLEKKYEDIIIHTSKQVESASESIKWKYSETYVRSACDSVLSTTSQIKRSGAIISQAMRSKVNGLNRAINIYKKSEKEIISSAKNLRFSDKTSLAQAFGKLGIGTLLIPYSKNMQIYKQKADITISTDINASIGDTSAFEKYLKKGIDMFDYVEKFITGALGKHGLGGFAIIEKNGYYIIKGSLNNKIIDKLNLGRRYKIENLHKYPNLQKVMLLGKFGDKIKDKMKYAKNLQKVANVLAYVGIGLDTIGGIRENIQNGETKWTKYTGDAVVDIGQGLVKLKVGALGAKGGAAIGGAVGSVICPGVGTVIGAGIGAVGGAIALGVFYTKLTEGRDIDGKSIKEWTQHGLTTSLDFASEKVGQATKAVGEMASKTYDNISNNVKNTKENLENAAQNAKDIISGVYKIGKLVLN